MFTRNDFLDRKCTLSQYYAQFVTPELINLVMTQIGADALLKSTHEHLSDIPLIKWDAMQPMVRPLIAPKMAKIGIEGVSLCECVCAAKQAARQWIKHNKPAKESMP